MGYHFEPETRFSPCIYLLLPKIKRRGVTVAPHNGIPMRLV